MQSAACAEFNVTDSIITLMSAQHGSAAPLPQAEHLRAARELIDAAAGHLAIDVLRRPRDGRWSIAEILEHLTLAFTVNAAALEKALAAGAPRARPPLLKQKLGRFLVVDLGYFPKAEAPAMVVPSGTVPEERSVSALQDALTLLDAVLTRVAERFGLDTLVANHPYFGGMSVRQWRKFHWRHTVHHMRQVRAHSSEGACVPPP